MTDAIECRGVRTHNLKNIDVNIPTHKWTAVTGVSGSGKSSLVFDTVYAESQRRFIETLGTYERQFLEGIPQGEADIIENLPAAVALKQTNRAGDPRSVIASTADLGEPLRLLFSSLMEPCCVMCGSPVETAEPAQLATYLEEQSKANNHQAILLSVPLEWPKEKSKKKELAQSLLQEGYLRFVSQQQLIQLDELSDKELVQLQSTLVVLDRIVFPIDVEELKNRVDTVWSQVKFSPRFSSITLVPMAHETGVESTVTAFMVQPFCPNCQTHTATIQQSDLDWQSVLGACRSCHGLGNVPAVDPRKVVPDPRLSVADGAIKPWASTTFDWMKKAAIKALKANGISPDTPYQDLPDDVKNWIWTGKDSEGRFKKSLADIVFLNDFFTTLEAERYKTTSRILLAKYRQYLTCPTCQGERLNQAGRNARCGGKRFPEIMNAEIRDTVSWLESLRALPMFARRKRALEEIHNEALRKLKLLTDLGLASSSLWRRTRTLSGGEYQRVLLTRVLGNGLTDALYVLDEPSVGLGRDEIPSLRKAISDLRDAGNTILMVEHDKALVSAADNWIELGPGGGTEGGNVLEREGEAHSLQMDKKRLPPPPERQDISPQKRMAREKEALFLSGFSMLNCKDLDLEIPFGQLTVIGGPSGAGKSTLVRFGLSAALSVLEDTGAATNTSADLDEGRGTWKTLKLPPRFVETHEIVSIEQKAAHRSVTSVAATVLGLMDILRRQFAQVPEAKEAGLSAGDFSFNSTGACETCEGKGNIKEDLFFLGEFEKICPDCGGDRYKSKVREVRWRGKNIVEWLATSLRDCLQEFRHQTSLAAPVSMAVRLGLGHLPLGLSTSDMSGGEAQRLRIAAALSKSNKKLFCILDEPTRGLSEYDVGNLLGTLLGLCQEGHTFVVVEHHEEFQNYAHQLVMLGPGGGRNGGKIVTRLARNS